MSNELENTLKKRYEKIIDYTNKIWNLEKEKYNHRSDFVNHVDDLSVANKASARFAMNPSDSNLRSAANISVSKEALDRDKKEIDKIKEDQLLYLDKI